MASWAFRSVFCRWAAALAAIVVAASGCNDGDVSTEVSAPSGDWVEEFSSITGEPNDERSATLATQMVAELYDLWPGPGAPMVPEELRGPVAEVVAAYIIDVNNAMLGGAQQEGHGASFDDTAVVALLRDLGADDSAQATIRLAQYVYLIRGYAFHLADVSNQDSPLDSRLTGAKNFTVGHGEVLAALDVGIMADRSISEAERQELLLARRQYDRAVFTTVSDGLLRFDQVAPLEVGVDDTATYQLLAEVFYSASEVEVELPKLDGAEAVLLWHASESAAEIGQLVEYAAYDVAPLRGLPVALADPGELRGHPRDEWSDPDAREEWQGFLTSAEDGAEIRETVGGVRDHIETSYRWQLSLPGVVG